MYGTVAGWQAYALERGDSAPTNAGEPAATEALTRASDYIQYRYVVNFLSGCDDTTPEVETATYVAASLELATPGFFSKTYTEAEQKVLTQVDGIKWTVVGDAKKANAAMPRSTLIDAMLSKCMPAEPGAGGNFGLWSTGC